MAQEDICTTMTVLDSREDVKTDSSELKDETKTVSATDIIRLRVRLSFVELSVKEVDSAIKECVKSQVVNVNGLSSWKFPHNHPSDVKVEEYLARQNRRTNISIENAYVNATEVLIDRLYYGINVFDANAKHLIEKIQTYLPKSPKSFSLSTLECGAGYYESTNIGLLTRRTCRNISNLKKLIEQLIVENSPDETKCDSAAVKNKGIMCKPSLKDAECQVGTTLYNNEWVENTIKEYECFIKTLHKYHIENCSHIQKLNILIGNETKKTELLKKENQLQSSVLAGKSQVIDDLKRQLLEKETFYNQRIVEMEQKSKSNIDYLNKCDAEKQKQIDKLKEELGNALQLIEDMQYFPDLNGPAIMVKEQSSVSETMKKQCEVNEERIRALQSMNSKYQKVIDKLDNTISKGN